MEKVVEQYLSKLCSRNVIQVAGCDFEARVRAFKWHDMSLKEEWEHYVSMTYFEVILLQKQESMKLLLYLMEGKWMS